MKIHHIYSDSCIYRTGILNATACCLVYANYGTFLRKMGHSWNPLECQLSNEIHTILLMNLLAERERESCDKGMLIKCANAILRYEAPYVYISLDRSIEFLESTSDSYHS